MMFNTTANNTFEYNVNAVSGTLRKSHPKSQFCVRRVSDSQFIFDSQKPRLTMYDEAIVVLQVMLTGENTILVEYVRKADFEGGCGNDA